MDEAGNTGENLLDPQQPIFALAATRLTSSDAEQAVQAALSRTQMSELKFGRLRSSNPGRRNILALLQDLSLTPQTAAVSVVHKQHMLAIKLVDELVEPRMLQRGIQLAWYARGDAKRMAATLAARGPRTLGETYGELAATFVTVVRDYSETAAEALQTALRRARIVSRDDAVSEILGLMIDGDVELRDEFATREDALDPALPSLFWQGSHWTKMLRAPFDVLHDDSKTVARWAHLFELIRRRVEDERMQGGSAEPRSVNVGEIEIDFPDEMASITFGQSHRDARLQVADLLAGAAAHLYAVATGASRADSFARDLRRAGIGVLIQHELGPEADAAAISLLRR